MLQIIEKLSFEQFIQMEALEKRFYSSEFITPADVSYEYYKRFPLSTVAAKDVSQVIGFINMFPVVDSVFRLLMSGAYNDSALTYEAIQTDESRGTLHMFLSCLAVGSECRRQGVTGALLRRAVSNYSNVSERCDCLVADNVTEEGRRFSQRLGLRFITESDHSSCIYALPYNEFVENIATVYKG